jgi:hypothetical protein
MPEIGETLRDARMRAHIDVSEIEAQTKIRAKYLRALENEEWSLLPGPTFIKSFLRTYATALGVDGKALVEEYRLNHEPPGDGAPEPLVSSPKHKQGGGRSSAGPSRGYFVVLGIVLLVIVLLVVGLLTGTGGGSSKNAATVTHGASPSVVTSGTHRSHHPSSTATGSGVVAVSVVATAPVYVCLVGDDGHVLIPGVVLQTGSRTATFHARRFLLALGNSAVKLIVDGTGRRVPPSSGAIGYSITRAAGRRRLPAGQLPACT